MNRKQKQTPQHHLTIVSATFFFIFKLMLCVVLAWFILMAWFSCEILTHGFGLAIIHAETMVSLNVHTIAENHSFLNSYLMDRLLLLHQCLDHFLDGGITWVRHSLLLVERTTEVDLSRLFLYILALPLFLLILFVLIVDGLVHRDIRKFQGARESTLKFHRTKRSISIVIFLPFFIFLASPVSLPESIFLFLHAVLIGCVARFALVHFKKYL